MKNQNSPVLSENLAQDVTWRAPLLRVMLIVTALLGIALLTVNVLSNPGFIGSAHGMVAATMVTIVVLAALFKQLPELLRLSSLLLGFSGLGTLNILSQGPVVMGVVLPFTLMLLLALFYWALRGLVVASCVVASVYVVGAYGWIHGMLPWDYTLTLQNPRSILAWVRAGIGQLMIGTTLAAIVYHVIRHSQLSLAALRTSEERARLLIEHAPEAIVVLDLTTQKFIVANPAAQSLFGLSIEILLTKSHLDMSPVYQGDGRLSSEAASSYLNDAMRGLTATFEWIHCNAAGQEILCEVRLLRLPDPKRVLMRGSILDLSERKRTERALRALSSYDASITGQAFFKASAEQLARELSVRCAMVAVLREHEGSRYINMLAFWPETEQRTTEYMVEGSIAAEVLTGSTLYIDHHVANRYTADPLLAEFFAESYLGVPIVDASARILGLVAVFDDKAIPDSAAAKLLLASTAARAAAELVRLKAAEEILQLNTALEQRVIERTAQLTTANAELESFSYSVSHDLRSPLRSIDGYASALEQDSGKHLSDQGRDYLQRIRDVTRRMHQLIDDMLQLSRAARATVKSQSVDLVSIALEVNKELGEQTHERKVEFRHPPQLHVHADPHLMRIVLANLFDNAWKYTSGRPAAIIELGKLPMPDERGATVYFVRDNGAGFDMSDVKKLFTPFQRLHDSSEFEGTGIGLATVQRIISRHHGHVWLESASDTGTTVFFTLGN